MSNLEEQDALLQQLIQQVVENADGSPEQREAMDRLLRLIPNLTGVYRPRNYPEAWNQALEGVSIYQGNVSRHNLRRFLLNFRLDINNALPVDVRTKFVRWFNRILNNKIIDQQRKLSNQPLSLDAPLKQGEGKTTREETVPDISTLCDLDSWSEREEKERTRLKGYILELYIESDPDGRLRSSYPNDCPECNCQLLLREEYLKERGETVVNMEQRFGINKQTIYAHRRRQCMDLLREIVQEIDKNFDEYASRLIGE